jgi:ATP-dependent protease Clp ATPase subunit
MICNFCGKEEFEVVLLIKGNDVYICDVCTIRAYNAVNSYLKEVKPITSEAK